MNEYSTMISSVDEVFLSESFIVDTIQDYRAFYDDMFLKPQ